MFGMKINGLKYKRLNKMQTGDLLLFTSNCWYSKVIELGTDSKYSHVGLVLVDPVCIDPSLTGTYLLESGREPFVDAIDKKYHFGVEIVPLSKVIHEYVNQGLGNIYHRKLYTDLDIKEKMNVVYQVIKDKPYNCNLFDWVEAWMGFHWFDTQCTNRFWCSALASYVYSQVGVLSKDVPWSLVTPKDLSIETKVNLPWINGSYLGEEVSLL
jgi:hypothetical protein